MKIVNKNRSKVVDLISLIQDKKQFAKMLYLGTISETKFYFDWRSHLQSFVLIANILVAAIYFFTGQYIIGIITFLLIELITPVHEFGHLIMSRLFKSAGVQCTKLFFGGAGGACYIIGKEYLNLDQKILISFGGILFQIIYNFLFFAIVYLFPSQTIFLLYKKFTTLNLAVALFNFIPIFKGSDGTRIFMYIYNECLYKQTRNRIENKYPVIGYVINYLR